MSSPHRTPVLVCAALLVLLTATATAASATASAPPRVRVQECGLFPRVRPATSVLTCADAGLRLTRLTWRSWGGRSAVATGSEVINICYPSCAHGNKVTLPAEVVLSRRQKGYYTRATVRLTPMARPPVSVAAVRTLVFDVTPLPS